MSTILSEMRQALEIESEGIQGLIARLDASAERAVEMLLACRGKVVVTGMGKSGHIGHKIAATFASTGTMAVFLHPAEAIHGDLGITTKDDVVLAISNSGGTEEILRLLGPLRRIGVPIIAMTGNPDSELAQRAEVHLNVGVPREACPLNLAPTSSTTAALAMGDALAVTLLKLKNFRAEDYALFHPGGNLGKKLLTTVADLMATGSGLPVVKSETPVKQVVGEIHGKKFGVTAVVNSAGALQGAFSLGDLMRLHIEQPGLEFLEQPVGTFINPSPRSIRPHDLAARALNVMETHNIRAVFVVDEANRPVGILGIYEVLRAIDY